MQDSRFDEIKKSPPKFFGAWMGQATWISVVALPVYIVNCQSRLSRLPSPFTSSPFRTVRRADSTSSYLFLPFIPALPRQPRLGVLDLLGFTIWATALYLENKADQQKSQWRRDQKKHEEKFISSGLWAYSRHPNYVVSRSYLHLSLLLGSVRRLSSS
jgi:hypothetical protein